LGHLKTISLLAKVCNDNKHKYIVVQLILVTDLALMFIHAALYQNLTLHYCQQTSYSLTFSNPKVQKLFQNRSFNAYTEECSFLNRLKASILSNMAITH